MIVILFLFFTLILITAAVLVVVNRNPVYCAIFLIIAFFAIAGLYFLLGAPFLSIVQIIVYAGAIMVLFLFVIMLLNLRQEIRLPIGRYYQIIFGALLSLILLVQLIFFVISGYRLRTVIPERSFSGTVENLGLALFNKYLYPFEIASVLLLVGMLGAIVLGRKKLPKDE